MQSLLQVKKNFFKKGILWHGSKVFGIMSCQVGINMWKYAECSNVKATSNNLRLQSDRWIDGWMNAGFLQEPFAISRHSFDNWEWCASIGLNFEMHENKIKVTGLIVGGGRPFFLMEETNLKGIGIVPNDTFSPNTSINSQSFMSEGSSVYNVIKISFLGTCRNPSMTFAYAAVKS